jgi:hypothetical protein
LSLDVFVFSVKRIEIQHVGRYSSALESPLGFRIKIFVFFFWNVFADGRSFL